MTVPARPQDQDRNILVAQLLMEIAVRVAYIEQLQSVDEDEVFQSARQLIKALRG